MTERYQNHVIKNIATLYGASGQAWLKKLPEFISRYEQKWQFTAKKSFPDAQFNMVLDTMLYDGSAAVFKCCFPNKEFTTEVLALAHYNGDGAVRLLKADIENGAMR